MANNALGTSKTIPTKKKQSGDRKLRKAAFSVKNKMNSFCFLLVKQLSNEYLFPQLIIEM